MRHLALKRLIVDNSQDLSKVFKELETRFCSEVHTCSSAPATRSSNLSFAYFSPFDFSFSYLARDSVSFLDKMPSCKSHKQVLMKLLVETSFDLTLQCYSNPLAYVFPCLYLDN